jgi:hypothetical protein
MRKRYRYKNLLILFAKSKICIIFAVSYKKLLKQTDKEHETCSMCPHGNGSGGAVD